MVRVFIHSTGFNTFQCACYKLRHLMVRVFIHSTGFNTFQCACHKLRHLMVSVLSIPLTSISFSVYVAYHIGFSIT